MLAFRIDKPWPASASRLAEHPSVITPTDPATAARPSDSPAWASTEGEESQKMREISL